MTVGLLNGALWGTLVGLFAMIVYHSPPLGLVMTSAVLLNLINAGHRGRAGAACAVGGRQGSRTRIELLTFATDSMGFFLFLGLATVFLL